MNLKKNRELFLHWLLTISGGFMGAYSIIALGGNFTNAITGNMINFMRWRFFRIYYSCRSTFCLCQWCNVQLFTFLLH